MVEESLVLSQYQFELSEEEFIIKEDVEMEARLSRLSLANLLSSNSRYLCLSVYPRRLYFCGLSLSNIVISC